MKTIITIVVGDDLHMKEQPSGLRAGQPKVEIHIAPARNADMVAGVLLVAYLNSARNFLDHHDLKCQECPAYRMHNSAIHHIDHIQRELLGLTTPTRPGDSPHGKSN